MQRRICLITGATEGVGKATATELAQQGFTIVMVARSQEKAELVKKEIMSSVSGADVDYIIANLSSLKEIHWLAEIFRQRYQHLDVLINNAGIVAAGRMLTTDGYEQTYQVNYLSQFFLASLLLDELKKSPQGRIINLSSSIYTAGKFDLTNLQSEKHFSTIAAYASSKLFVLMFTIALSERLEGTKVTANVVHPGIVRTNMMFRSPGLLRVITYLALPFSISVRKGAATSVYLATSPGIASVSGKYFTKSNMAAASSKYNTKENRDLLWNQSMASLEKSTQKYAGSTTV